MSTTHIPAELRRLVRERAAENCEYCLIPESITLATHAIDHIVAEKHGGRTVADNLALSCTICNAHKGTDLASVDPETGTVVPLYHPRRDRWNDHFVLAGGRFEARTAIGRATIRLLQLNSADRIEERRLLVAAGVIRIPPTSPPNV
jgi:5-methylcytosine-specific restriction endonuclease McrA